ncbi:hypothetical protein [Flavobacterium marginilacus]|nr:hypothetical protein [Flavobacterium marginilacus]
MDSVETVVLQLVFVPETLKVIAVAAPTVTVFEDALQPVVLSVTVRV